MKLLIDADGCPVTAIAVTLAASYHVPCTIFCDTAHMFHSTQAQIVTVSKGTDSVDFALVNHICAGDIVITQDYGLAAMCLSKNAIVIHQDGFLYTNENIDGLLFFRAAAKKARRAGTRMKGPHKRTKAQDEAFRAALEKLLEGHG